MNSIRPSLGIFATSCDQKHEEHIVERFAREYCKTSPTISDNSKLALALNFTQDPFERETTLAKLISSLNSNSEMNNYRNINIALKFATTEERNIINESLIILAFKNINLNKKALFSLAISVNHEIKQVERIKWIKLILNKLNEHSQYEAKQNFLNHFLWPLVNTLPKDELNLFSPLLNESIAIAANHLNAITERILTAIQFNQDPHIFLPKIPQWNDILRNLSEFKQDIESKASLRQIDKLRNDEIPSLHHLEKAIPSIYTDRILTYILTFSRSNPPTHYWKFLKDAYPYTSKNIQQKILESLEYRINLDSSDIDRNWKIHFIFMSLQNLENENEYLIQINKIMALRDSPCTDQTINTSNNPIFMCDLYSYYLAKINQRRAQKNEAGNVLLEKTELPEVIIGVTKMYI